MAEEVGLPASGQTAGFDAQARLRHTPDEIEGEMAQDGVLSANLE